MIYLDNNATTAVDPEVRDAMLPWLGERYGNPSSLHRAGQEARQAVEHARHQTAALVGCDVREVVFTSGGTEADNAAIHGLLLARPGKKTIVTSSVEHSAVREPLHFLAKQGYRVEEIPVNTLGHLDMSALAEALSREDVALATFLWANNETGVLFDVAAIGELAHRYGVPVHVDAVQAVGKLGLNFTRLPVDLLSLSGHKFHGPKGVGALVVRRGVRWVPWLRGGPQERDRRGGTENVAGIVGLGAAADLARAALEEPGLWARVAGLRNRLEAAILRRVPDTHVNGDPANRLPNTTNIGFAALEAEAILLLASEQELCASAGAACSSGSLEPSHVLKAMGLPERVAHGAVRLSLSRETTQEEVDRAVEILVPIIERLRSVLPTM